MFGFGGSKKNEDGGGDGGGGAPEGAANAGKATESAAPSEGDGEKKIGSMPSGDYNIHIHLQTAKNIIMAGEDDVDPYVQIECLGQSVKSAVKNNVTPASLVNFNEHIFIELKKMDKDQMEEATMKLTILNKGFFKGDVIGEIELSLQKIYNKKGHVMMHQRLGLNDPNGEDFSKMTGTLILSINVQGPGDDAQELKMGSTKEIEKNSIMMPSSVKKEYKQLYLRVYQASNLPKMDYQLVGTGSIDAYLKIKYKGKKLQTKVIRQEDNLVPWMQEFFIPVEIPVIHNNIVIELYDEDEFTSDLAATTTLQVKSLIKYDISNENNKGRSQCKWINLFGAPTGRSGKNTDKMNKDPSAASNWKGRILVEYWCEDFKYPVFKTRNIPADFDRYNFEANIEMRRFMIMGEFGQGLCLPSEQEYKLRFKLAEIEYTTSEVKEHSLNMCRWDERFGGDVIELPYTHGKYMPTFYIYLVDEDDKEVCFYRNSLMDQKPEDGSFRFKDQFAPHVWSGFEPDLAHGEVTDEKKAGYFSFRLYFHELDREGPFDPNTIPSWKAKPPTRQSPFRCRVALYQCENLPPADEQGHSDPYIRVYDPWHKEGGAKTETCDDTNNPIFYEVKEFTFNAPSKNGEINLRAAPPIIINIFDEDNELMDSTDDLIGRCVIDLADVARKEGTALSFDDEIPYPAWYPVLANYDDEYDHETGAALLCSIQIKNYDENYAIPTEQIQLNVPNQIIRMPNLNMAEFKCEVIVLGLRDLVSTGLMNVNKPYIKFAIKSLLPVSQASAVDNIFTEPNAKGSNPIIRTTIQFEVMLADDPTFLPRMTCEVFDQLFMGGVGQPHIGTFTLKFGDAVTEMREKLEDDITMAQQLAKTVEKVKKRIKGKPMEERQRVAEICAALSASQRDDTSAMTQEQKLGMALMKQLESQGLQLPTTNAMKRKGRTPAPAGGRTGKKKDVQEETSSNLALARHGTTELETDFSKLSPADQKEAISRAVGGNIRRKVQVAFEADLAAKKKALDIDRKEGQLDMANRPGAYGNKVMPLYKFDERLNIDVEVDIPTASLFKPIGYNKKPSDGIKHYRRYYPDELENVTDKNGNLIVSRTFLHETIFRSKPVKQGGLLSGLFGGDSGGEFVSLPVGHFKGVVKCYIPAQREEAEAELRAELRRLMEQILAVYEIEQDKKAPIKADLVEKLATMKPNDRDDALQKIRLVIEDAGIEKLNIFPMIDDLSFQQSLIERLNKLQKCKVFLYMIEGFNFAQRDMFSASDPYLKINCGSSKFNERDNYQLDTATPKFYKCYQFECEFPGSPQLQIEAWDYDGLFGDDKIGFTKIDLDDRFYSQPWLALEDKPIEYRDLFDESSTITQGVVKLWVEIYDADDPAASLPPIDINSAPLIDFEVRVVIWKTEDIEMMDVEGTSDVFIKAFFDQEKDQNTDTHWRCQNGKASFNYRLKFPIKASVPLSEEMINSYLLTIQAWDKDIIASNDLIGSFQLPIHYLVEDALLTDTPRYINSKYFQEYMKDQLVQFRSPLAYEIEFDSEEKDRFWVPVHRRVEDKDTNIKAGKIQMSVAVIPVSHAEKDPQGKGREMPNSDPFCPEPEGRIKMSLNPFEMFNQMVGPAVRRKIFLFLLCIACAFLCAMMAPMIFSNILTKAVIG